MQGRNVLFAGEEVATKKDAHIILPPPKVEPLHEVFAETMLEDISARYRLGAGKPKAKAINPVILPPPKVEPLHEVFAETMLEDNPARQRRSAFDWVLSLALHLAILSALLILPLYYTAGLDFQKFNLTFLTPPVIPAAPVAPLPSSAAPRTVRTMVRPAYVPGKLTVPTFIPRAIMTTPGESIPPDASSMGVSGGVPGGQLGGVIGGELGGVLKNAPPPPLPASVAAGPKKPVLVGVDVKPPVLLFGPEPDYPILAKQSHITGIVVIEAIIDEHGIVTGMRVISGHPLLIPQALKAVSKRRYEPTILNGEPTPIDLRVEISFRLT